MIDVVRRFFRVDRFQLVTEDGTAWLAAVQGGQWTLEACYDLLPATLLTPLT